MSAALHIVPVSPAVGAAASLSPSLSPSLSQRVRQLQAEAARLAREHIAQLEANLIQTRDLAAEIAQGGEAYPPGVRELARRLADDSLAQAVVSVAGAPEPRTARLDLGGRRLLAAGFWVISYGVRQRARRAGLGYRYLFMHPSGNDLAQLADLIEQGSLRVIIDKTYPFAEIAEALDYLESRRAKGKVVVVQPASPPRL